MTFHGLPSQPPVDSVLMFERLGLKRFFGKIISIQIKISKMINCLLNIKHLKETLQFDFIVFFLEC